MNKLIEIGFQHVGRWRLCESGLELCLDRMVDVSPAMYAFVVDGRVKYVGKTMRALGRRLYGYRNPGKSQRTNRRVRNEIVNTLRADQQVDVFAFADNTVQQIGTFRLNIPAALEDDVIAQLRPPWNGSRRGEDLEGADSQERRLG